MQHGASATVKGYQADAAALVDLHELRYQWFDSVLKGGARPAVLEDHFNYHVMGANEWGHAPSLEAAANGSPRLYLDGGHTGGFYRLTDRRPSKDTFIAQNINFVDRSDARWTPPATVVGNTLPIHNGMAFVTDPLPQPLTITGRLSGQLDVLTNKRDMDLSIALYEQLPTGEYLRLFDPLYEIRASYAENRSRRRLLKPGIRQQLPFSTEQVTSRKLQTGSRLVLVLSVVKRPDQQINYGTGKDVSDESIADARTPMKLRWYSGSYLEVPVWR
jgi:predicted acyl esterase